MTADFFRCVTYLSWYPALYSIHYMKQATNSESWLYYVSLVLGRERHHCSLNNITCEPRLFSIRFLKPPRVNEWNIFSGSDNVTQPKGEVTTVTKCNYFQVSSRMSFPFPTSLFKLYKGSRHYTSSILIGAYTSGQKIPCPSCENTHCWQHPAVQ